MRSQPGLMFTTDDDVSGGGPCAASPPRPGGQLPQPRQAAHPQLARCPPALRGAMRWAHHQQEAPHVRSGDQPSSGRLRRVESRVRHDAATSRGAKFARINRSVDDPNLITVVSGFDSLDAVNEFMSDPDLKPKMQEAGVAGEPRVEIYEEVEVI